MWLNQTTEESQTQNVFADHLDQITNHKYMQSIYGWTKLQKNSSTEAICDQLDQNTQIKHWHAYCTEHFGSMDKLINEYSHNKCISNQICS
jgi:hypothetical protein